MTDHTPNPPPSDIDDSQEALDHYTHPHWLKRYAPIPLTLGLMVWVFYGVSWEAIADAIRSVDMGRFIPLMAVYMVMYIAGDSTGFGGGFKWMVPEMSWKEVYRLRFAALLPQAAMAQLAGAFSMFYLYRRYRAHPFTIAGSVLFMVLCEAILWAGVTAVGLVISGDHFSPWWYLYPGQIIATLIFALVTSKTRLQPILEKKFGSPRIFHAFRIAPFWRYGWAMAVRSPIVIGQILIGYYALRAVGLEVPLGIVMVALPLSSVVAFMPISLGGFGGPQAAMVYFLAGYGSEEQILAFSLLWSAGFALGRSGVGMIFLPGAWKMIGQKTE